MKNRPYNPRPVSHNPVYLHAIATALPENRLQQSEILSFMKRLQAETPEREAFLQKVYDGSAIDTRYSVLQDYRHEWQDFTFYPRDPRMEPSPSTARRNEVFVHEADRLALRATESLFDEVNALKISMKDITHLVTVSCTGFSAPGFDLTLQKELGMSENLQRFHLGFMGCYAAFPAMKLAWNICRSDSTARVLIVDVELCTLHFQKNWEPDTVVANALFADGCAAALVSAQPQDSPSPLYILDDFATRMIPDSGDKMAWIIGETGFDMRLSSYVPRVIDTNMPPIIDEILVRNKLQRADIGRWAIHPGGRAILDKLGKSLSLGDSALADSYQVLRDYGNMSSATIFYVLKLMAKAVRPAGERIFAAAFGPGLTVESAVLSLLPVRTPRKTRQPLLFPRLEERSYEPELMDSPRADTVLLRRTITQFGLLNKLFSAYRKILKREFFALMNDKNKCYTILDIGAGGGDIPIWMAREARKRGLTIRITCIDQDERIIPWAREAVQEWPEIEVVHLRAEELSNLGKFDFMFCNHVMHHLSEEAIVSLLRATENLCTLNFVFNDLRRSAWAYIGYTIFTGLFLRKSLAFYDGRLSIRRGFLRIELEKIIARAGLTSRLRIGQANPARLFVARNQEIPEG